MVKILSLDVATECGWSVIDPDDTLSSIRLGHFRCEGKEPWEKAATLREKIRDLVRVYGGNTGIKYAVIEMPFSVAPQYDKKAKADLASGTKQDQVEMGRQMIDRLKTAVERYGIASTDVREVLDDYFSDDKTINPKTMALLNWLVGTAQAVCLGMGMQVEIVRPQTWRTVLTDPVKKMNVGTKDKVRVQCDQWGIVGGDNNARDAAVMGVWCMRKSQSFKMFMREFEQESLL